MYRAIVYFGLASFVVSVLGILIPDNASVMSVFLPSLGYAIVAIILSLILIFFGIESFFRSRLYKTLFGVTGSTLLLISIASILLPWHIGLLNSFMNSANIVPFLVLGIGYIVAAIEYSRPSLVEELSSFYSYYFLWNLPKNIPS